MKRGAGFGFAWVMTVWGALAAGPGDASAGTFVPSPLSESPRIDAFTRSLARDWVDRDLMGDPYASVVVGRADVYDRFPYFEARYFLVVSDPEWNRILYGAIGKGVRAFDGEGSAFGSLRGPRGMTTDPEGRLYVADSDNHRVVVFQTESEYDRLDLVPLYALEGMGRPFDVAYSDGGTPFAKDDDRLYVADAGRNAVLRFVPSPSGAGAQAAGSIGDLGSGVGRFAGPTALAVGRADGVNTPDVFVADAHNGRIVHLRDTSAGLEWVGSVARAGGAVTSLDTDHWGNVYVASPEAGLAKLAPDLEPVATLSDGVDRPRSFRIPFVTVVDHRDGSVTRAGEGSGVLVEEWSGGTGLRLLSFGVEVNGLSVSKVSPSDGMSDLTYSAEFTLTDRADVVATLVDRSSGRIIARRDAGTLDAGSQSLTLSAPEQGVVVGGAGASGGSAGRGGLVVRIEARSTYGGAPGGESEFVLSVPGDPDTPGAGAVALLGNDPNPFNPSTTIRFVVPDGEARAYNLRVFDAAGRLVRTLGAGSASPGMHAVPWDGRDDAGRDVASGVYLCRLTVGRDEAVNKMVLEK